MQTQSMFEFSKDDSLTGFRLQRLEVLNWGTFHGKIWKIEPLGFNSLLTGDIGSGKSTLVDALTTLLVQHNKITYNKAAGAEGKERNLYRYIRGAYANTRGEELSAKPQYLREKDSHTVLLASFYNDGYGQKYTLAQVFWLRDDEVQKMYIISSGDLNIREHFTGFGTEISELKKRLKKLQGTEVLDSYKEYSARFSNYFGIKSEKAMDLFYQTVSLKSVNNLDEFVRVNMLEKREEETKSEIEGLKKNFEDLNIAHEAIQNAKQQIEKLLPIIAEADSFEKVESEMEELEKQHQSLPSFFAHIKISVLEPEIRTKEEERKRLENLTLEIEEELKNLRENEISLNVQIQNLQESKELDRLNYEMEKLEGIKKNKKKNSDLYNDYITKINYIEPETEDSFYALREKAQKDLQEKDMNLQVIDEEILRFRMTQKDLSEKRRSIEAELESLRRRKSLIPETNLRTRKILLDHLDLEESKIPFAGELIRVKDKEWEGAAERVLHGFALSLLVPDDLYSGVSTIVNKVNLKSRIVYYRVRPQKQRKDSNIEKPLFDRLEIKSDSEFYEWLENELRESYGYSCAESLDEFQKMQRAVTKEGQIKYNQSRHEKDDRRDILDRSSYVLGWNNKEKIQSMEISLENIVSESASVQEKFQQAEKGKRRLEENISALKRILEFENYHELNWKKEASEITEIRAKILELKNSSDMLKVLNVQLDETRNRIREKDSFKSEKNKETGNIQSYLASLSQQKMEQNRYLEMMTEDERNIYFPRLNELYISERILNTADAVKVQEETQKKITAKRSKKQSEKDHIRTRLITKMTEYRNLYKSETTEVDSSEKSIPEFRKFLSVLQEEDLPRFEEKFKNKLNRDVIQGISMFKAHLEEREEDVREKIEKINRSLRDIEYNRGTYIVLNCERTGDIDISGFRAQLRHCFDHVLQEDIYNEEKFRRVKAIIDRFSGGSDLDTRWTAKVTDVTNWFIFSATEKYISDNSEKESYSGSSGKSGGQKEKLAYTVLASALAYQFGLEWKEVKSRSFRFALIDEAFGRGSDESTRYGLELFKKLNLQLLIVTPLQKINIIEEYIRGCHLVVNDAGKYSSVKNFTIEEYLAEKEKFKA